MTRRVLILGNSHLAALKSGLDRRPERWPDIAFTMVGGPIPVLQEMEVRGRRLTGWTDRAREAISAFTGGPEVDLTGHDAVVVAGTQVAVSRLIGIARHMAWADMPSLGPSPDIARVRRLFVSAPAVRRTAEAVLEASCGVRLARRMVQDSGLPVIVASQPRPSARVLDHPKSKVGHILGVMDRGDGEVLSRLFEEAAEATVTAAGARFLPQPPETIRDHVLTELRFSLGAVRLKAEGGQSQPRDDVLHANGRYGWRVLDQIAAAL